MLWSRLWLQEPIQMWGHACFDVFGATGLANVETVFIMVCWVCYILALFKPPVDKRSDHSGRPALSFAAQCACAFVFNKKHALLQSCSKHFGAKKSQNFSVASKYWHLPDSHGTLVIPMAPWWFPWHLSDSRVFQWGCHEKTELSDELRVWVTRVVAVFICID